jgi:hypothetical protein
MLFREYLEEAVPTFNIGDFGTPTPRAKFQISDIVVARDDGRWLMYQSKKSAPYINQVGKIIGYKNIPGSYTKFAVEFSDGAKVPIHSHFLIGPFKDVNIAKQYADDPKKEIKPEDYAAKKGVTVHAVYQVDQPLEDELKALLTTPEFGFTWLEEPLLIKAPDHRMGITGKDICHVLAQKPCSIQDGRYSDRLVEGYITVYRVNRSDNRALKPITSNSLNNLEGKSSNTQSAYIVELPVSVCTEYFTTPFTFDDLFKKAQFGVTLQTVKKFKNALIKNIQKFNNWFSYVNKGKTLDDHDIIDIIYNVTTNTDGVKIINNNVNYFITSFKDPYIFKDYYINGHFSYDESAFNGRYRAGALDKAVEPTTPYKQLKDCTFMPSRVIGIVELANDNGNIKSLKGFTQKIGGDRVTVRYCHGITSLEGLPPAVSTHLEVSQCNKLQSLKGCPEIESETDKYLSVDIHISSCPQITSLNGLPKNVKGDLKVIHCGITTLQGAPDVVTGTLDVERNKLTNLVGCSQNLGSSKTDRIILDVSKNPLTSLRGIPLDINPDLVSARDTKFEKEKDLKKEIEHLQVLSNISTDTKDSFEDLLNSIM